MDNNIFPLTPSTNVSNGGGLSFYQLSYVPSEDVKLFINRVKIRNNIVTGGIQGNTFIFYWKITILAIGLVIAGGTVSINDLLIANNTSTTEVVGSIYFVGSPSSSFYLNNTTIIDNRFPSSIVSGIWIDEQTMSYKYNHTFANLRIEENESNQVCGIKASRISLLIENSTIINNINENQQDVATGGIHIALSRLYLNRVQVTG